MAALSPAAGNDIGSYVYHGYHDGAASLPGNGANAYTASPAVFVAASGATIDWTDPLNPVAGANGPSDNGTVNAAAFVGSGVEVKGFRLVSYLENGYLVSDDAGGVAFGGPTATNTTFTDTLTGFTISDVSFAVELQTFGVD